MTEAVEFRYRAFLSYAHADTSWAKWLHGRLEAFRIDRDLAGRATSIGVVPASLRPVFRDRDDFTGGHSLTDATIAALDASGALVVLCSPHSARSKYVNEEVRLFRWRHPERPVIPVVIEGTYPDNFPPALRNEVDADGAVTDRSVMLLGPDLREHADGRQLGLAKVVGGMIGVGSDDIYRRAERARRHAARFRNGVIAVLAFLAVAAAGSAAYARHQLKTNEAFLDATLKSFTSLVDRAVKTGEAYSLPLNVTRGFLEEAEGMLSAMSQYGQETPKLKYRKAVMLSAFADNYRDLGQTTYSAWVSLRSFLPKRSHSSRNTKASSGSASSVVASSTSREISPRSNSRPKRAAGPSITA
jgi:TIR domain